MASARKFQKRIRSVKTITQVTRAMQAVSTSRVRFAVDHMMATRPYTHYSLEVMRNIASQQGSAMLHPLLEKREEVKQTLVVLVSGNNGLAGSFYANLMDTTFDYFSMFKSPIRYISIGQRGTELLYRNRKRVHAEFNDLPDSPEFDDSVPIGKMVMDAFLNHEYDEVYLVYMDFVNMVKQEAKVEKILPLGVEKDKRQSAHDASVYAFEPNADTILNQMLPEFITLQIHQGILESQASEHAARMVAMKNATENGEKLRDSLQIKFNNARQQSVTNEMLDIVGGAEAMGSK